MRVFSRRSLLLVLEAAFLVCGGLLADGAVAATLPSGFRDGRFLTDLKEPTAFAFAPDGVIFAAEKSGRIVVYDDLADAEKSEFVDIRTEVFDHRDRGLLSMVLDPDFPSEPYVYALYSYDHLLGDPAPPPKWGLPDDTGDECVPAVPEVDACPVSGRLVRFTAEAGPDGYVAAEQGGEPEQEVLVEDWCQQFSSHSVGQLEFAADGSLYASGGDGASFGFPDYGQEGWPQKNQCGDPPGAVGDELEPPSAEGGALRSQDLLTPATPGDPTGLSGTVIRIDPDTGEGLPGNPLFGSLDANERRIVAFGYRNPFRIALDPDRDELYVANVGWSSFEEIDRVPALPAEPVNSGWPCYEGPTPNPGYQSLGLNLCAGLYADPGDVEQPFFFYRHGTEILPGDGCATADGSAVAGMLVYPGGALPDAYDGALFFADMVRKCIYVMYAGEDGAPDPETTELFLGDGGLFPGGDIQRGPEGNLYYLSHYGTEDEGSLHRVSFDPDSPFARVEATPRWGSVPLQVQFDAGASSDPNGAELEYDWDLDGDGSYELLDAGAKPKKTYFDGSKNVKASVRVGNGSKASVAQITVFPGNHPPQPVIEAPDADLSWGVGQEIEFEGYADDEEEGELAVSGLRWKTQLLHCPIACHAHPLQLFPGTDSGDFVAPDHDWPARIKLVLTATDARGLSATTEVEILPRKVDLRIESDPPGLEISAGPLTRRTPFVLPAIEGSFIVLSAPPSAQIDGTARPWLSWSDGGTRVHSILAEEPGTYLADYLPEPAVDPPARHPQSRLRKRPPAATAARTARFAFSSDLPGSSFRCKLDAKPYRPCRSPRVYRNLAPGPHVLRVLAIAADGTPERAPTVFRWKVLPVRD